MTTLTILTLSMLGDKRADALMRVFAFFWAWVAAVIVSVIAIVALVWGIVDVVWQLLLNSEGLGEEGFAPMLVTDSFQWFIDLKVYAFTGKRQFNWLPQM